MPLSISARACASSFFFSASRLDFISSILPWNPACFSAAAAKRAAKASFADSDFSSVVIAFLLSFSSLMRSVDISTFNDSSSVSKFRHSEVFVCNAARVSSRATIVSSFILFSFSITLSRAMISARNFITSSATSPRSTRARSVSACAASIAASFCNIVLFVIVTVSFRRTISSFNLAFSLSKISNWLDFSFCFVCWAWNSATAATIFSSLVANASLRRAISSLKFSASPSIVACAT